MPLKAARIINSLVVMLMLLEIFGAAVTAISFISHDSLSYHAAKPRASVIAAFLFEKAEEENEKTEEEREHSDRVVLVDFTWVASSLSSRHTSNDRISPVTTRYDLRPPVYTLNCVLLI